MRKWIAAGIRRRFMVLLLMVMVLPLSVLGAMAYAYSVWTMEKDYIEHSRKYLRQVSENLDHNIKYMDMISIMSFMDKSVIKTLLDDQQAGAEKTPQKQEAMEEFLFKASELMEAISGVYIFSDAAVYYKSRLDVRVDMDYDYKNASWYQDATSKGGTLSIIGAHRPDQMNSANHYVFSVARSIIHPQSGQRVGVILIDARIEVIQRLASVEQVYDESYLIITDSEGCIIYSPRKSDITGQFSLENENYLARESGNCFAELGGERTLINYVTSDYTGWKIIQAIPARIMYRSTDTIAMAMLLSALVFILLSVVVSLYLSRRVATPIVKLCGVVERIGQGHLDDPTPVGGSDEIGRLDQGIREMARSLRELMHRVTTIRLRQREAQLEFLQSQINPHFLYNALNSIQMAAVIHGDMEVSHMADHLGSFYKLSNLNVGSIVTVREELNLVTAYLAVIRMRFGEEFRCAVEVDDEIAVLYCIKLTLQPIVENAVFHGLEKKAGCGEIAIRARREDDVLELVVSDNGVGMSLPALTALRLRLDVQSDPENGQNIGLCNVHERLRLHFGASYGIQVDSAEGMGTTVTVRLPVLTSRDGLPADALLAE